jgi:hypothetical protein
MDGFISSPILHAISREVRIKWPRMPNDYESVECRLCLLLIDTVNYATASPKIVPRPRLKLCDLANVMFAQKMRSTFNE